MAGLSATKARNMWPGDGYISSLGAQDKHIFMSTLLVLNLLSPVEIYLDLLEK